MTVWQSSLPTRLKKFDTRKLLSVLYFQVRLTARDDSAFDEEGIAKVNKKYKVKLFKNLKKKGRPVLWGKMKTEDELKVMK